MMDVLRAHGLGKGLNSADKQALIDLVNAADANQSAVKTDIINKLKAKDSTLPLNAASTWADILAAIPQIKIGKKWANGSISVISAATAITVSGLNFRPSFVLVYYHGTGGTPVHGFNVFNNHTYNDTNFADKLENRSVSWGNTQGIFTASAGTWVINNDGFTLTPNRTGYPSDYALWWAFE
jgi:hypothetical protein